MRGFFAPVAFATAFIVAAAPKVALADDPSENSNHTGKSVDGKTNGVTPETGVKVREQEKEQPKIKGDPNAESAPASVATPAQ